MPDPGSESSCAAIHAARCAGCGVHHRQPQRLAVQSAAQHQGVAPTHAQLGGDVVDHAVIGGGGGGQHRDLRAEFGDQGADAPVVGPEVVAPVGHAVRLVDDHQACIRSQGRQHVVTEVRIVQPFGADQQHVETARGDLLVDALPLGDVAGVDGGRADAGALRRGHLVAHQRQQRRNDHRGAVAAASQQLGCDEVHRRLTPAGALNHQRAAPVHHQRLDRRPLVVAQRGTGAGELFEDRLSLRTGCHGPILPGGCDGRETSVPARWVSGRAPAGSIRSPRAPRGTATG